MVAERENKMSFRLLEDSLKKEIKSNIEIAQSYLDKPYKEIYNVEHCLKEMIMRLFMFPIRFTDW